MVITMSRFWGALVILAALCLPLASSHAAPDPLHPEGPPASLQAPGADLLIVAQAGGIVPAIPGVPFSLRAVAASSTQINLTWTDASTNEAGFQIQRKIGSGVWLPLATVGSNVTAYANTGLVPATTYGYRVRAFDRSGNSAWSNIATAKTLSGSVQPPAPTGLSATVASQSQINLSWTDNSSNETLFKIERKIGTRAWAQIATVGANVTTYANTGLTASTRYSYRVRAASGSNNSLYSNVVSATIPRPTVPAAPSGLTAAAVSTAQINLTWSDNSSNESGFRIERKTGSGGWSEIATVGANLTSYASSGLTAATTYVYRVQAYNALGYSLFSNEASATTPSTPTGPVAPTGLTATAASPTQINLAWTDASSNETGFKIERKTGTGAWSQIATVGANVATYASTGLTGATTYGYRVRATNAVGDSAYSNEASATTPATPTVPVAPTGLTATAASPTQINLAWTDASSNETGFKIERKTGTGAWSQIATVGANVATYASTGLTGATTYGYRVRATNAVGDSAYSNEASATTPASPTAPVAPSGLTATAAATPQISLAWVDNSTNETGFKVERKTGTGAWSQIATVGTNVTVYTDPGLATFTAYSYRVRATNAVGDSAYSNEASATTPGLPTVPVGLTATAMSVTQINLAWTDSSANETGFKIERKTGTGTWSEIVTLAANVVTYPNTGLTASTLYTYRMRACNAVGCSGYSNEASATTFGANALLNDTGIDWCGDNEFMYLGCPAASYPLQDGDVGRDATHDNPSDGHAGFSFTKLDANGNPLAASATNWSCVRDNVTGLIWEVKTDDGGLRDKDWTYTWYNSDSRTNGGSAGTQNRGSCTGSDCDTQGFAQAVNAQGLCGKNDWRVPTRFELRTILNLDGYVPTIERAYFPNTKASWVWSSSPWAAIGWYDNHAWSVGFGGGGVGYNYKYQSYSVRLVRGRE